MTVHGILAIPAVYKTLTAVVGGGRSRRLLVDRFIRPRERDWILDIGCGPADILDHLPAVNYIGFDASQAYISEAERRFGNRGEFRCGLVSEERLLDHKFDIVLALGVVHHLGDEDASALFRLAQRTLRPHGRLITVDGVYVEGQSWPARMLLERDRGKFVRSLPAYHHLATQAFADVSAQVVHDLVRPFPYTHLIMECATGAHRDSLLATATRTDR